MSKIDPFLKTQINILAAIDQMRGSRGFIL